MKIQDPKGVVIPMVHFWASMTDCFLQDFAKAVQAGDDNAIMIEATKLEQLGSAMEQWFGMAVSSLMETEEHEQACDAAANAVCKVIEEKMEEIVGEDGPPTIRDFN